MKQIYHGVEHIISSRIDNTLDRYYYMRKKNKKGLYDLDEYTIKLIKMKLETLEDANKDMWKYMLRTHDFNILNTEDIIVTKNDGTIPEIGDTVSLSKSQGKITNRIIDKDKNVITYYTDIPIKEIDLTTDEDYEQMRKELYDFYNEVYDNRIINKQNNKKKLWNILFG
jgi:hypothetical protein